MSRIQRILAWGLFTLVLLVLSGWLLADHLTPRAFGVPSHALPLQAAQTELDREIVPLVARHDGQAGIILVPDGLRSEEHTSELQSLMRISYAVFCLTKKKCNKIKTDTT